MGTICAPAYANIFMVQFEKTTYISVLQKLINTILKSMIYQ